MRTPEDKECRSRLEYLERLIHEIEELPDPSARDHARELVQALLEYHGTALARLIERITAADESGQAILGVAADDELVSSLLLLHGLHPEPLEIRIRRALETVRPYLKSHGGGVELIGIDPSGNVRLRMEGNCHGCPSSALTLTNAIEEAILAAAPDVSSFQVEGVESNPQPIPHLVPLEVDPLLKSSHRVS